MFFHEYPLEEIISAVEEAGLDSVEFWVETPAFWLAGQPRDELVSLKESSPVMRHATLHAPILDLNPTSINPVIAEVSVRFVCDAIRLAASADIPIVTVHPGRRTAKRVPSAPDYEKFERYLRSLEEVSRETGVVVSMENMENKVNSLVGKPEVMRDLLDREPWLSFTLDISHAMGDGPGQVERYIELCGERLVNVHVGAAAGGRMHLPVGGNTAVRSILRDLAQMGYDGNLMLEIEDLALSCELSYEEKILLLARESEFMKTAFG